MARILAALWLALLVVAAPATAQTFPPLTGRVVDQAHLLRPEQMVDLNSKLAALEAQSGRQLVVATIPSLEGRTIEDYGYRLGRTWGIGGKDKDDGVILLVAPTEHKVRIETGYGARVFLTDALSSVIIREAIVPKFKAGDMGGGIVAGADAIIAQMQLPPAAAAKRIHDADRVETQRAKSGGAPFVPAIFIVILFFMIIGRISRSAGGGRRYRHSGGISPWVVLWGLNALSRGRGGGWGGGGGFGGGGFGGGGGGGFGGFSGGGGSFGGGGASGGW